MCQPIVRQIEFAETLGQLESGDFSLKEFLEKRQELFPNQTGTDADVEAALASLYLQKMVQHNVLSPARGQYTKSRS